MVSRRRKTDSTRWTSAASRRLLKLAGHAGDVPRSVEVVAGRLLESVECPPTDLEALGRKLGILRYEAEPLPISGQLRGAPGGLVVVYSSFLSPPRRRFTIAHEIAHAVFETSGRGVPRYGRELERICDMLATEFLMPGSIFRLHCGTKAALNWEKIVGLADRFQASLSATAIRCAELLGVTVFEIEKDKIVWGFGSVQKGPVAKLDDDLIEVIEAGRVRQVFDAEIYVRNGNGVRRWWDVQSKSVGRDGRLFMLMKAREYRSGEDFNGVSPIQDLF